MITPSNHFTIALDEINTLGTGLHRPECVACTQSGDIWVSHVGKQGTGVARIDTNGVLHPLVGNTGAPDDFMPNGWCMDVDGSFVIANLADSGGVWRLHPDGHCTPELLEISGLPMPPVNFVHRDTQGSLWISVSTWRVPRDLAFHRDVADGFIILMNKRGTQVVADGLGYSNEVKVDPSGEYLYVNETIARRLSRYRILNDGLGPRETVTDYMDGTIPDGFEFDAEGGIWCASVMSNRLLRVLPDGTQHIILQDNDSEEIQQGMNNWRSGKFTRDDLNIGGKRKLRNIASITFGGDDLKTVYLGSLFGDSLFHFRSPIAGAAPPHWLISR